MVDRIGYDWTGRTAVSGPATNGYSALKMLAMRRLDWVGYKVISVQHGHAWHSGSVKGAKHGVNYTKWESGMFVNIISRYLSFLHAEA